MVDGSCSAHVCVSGLPSPSDCFSSVRAGLDATLPLAKPIRHLQRRSTHHRDIPSPKVNQPAILALGSYVPE